MRLAEAVGTPFYCYSTATLERHYRVFTDAFAGEKPLVCYAMKANSNQSVLRTLARLGAGADVVSGGELKRALRGGHSGRARSCSPASARPKPSCAPRWRRTFSASMWNPSPNSICCRSLSTADWAAPRASRSASIQMSIPARTPRFRPASRKTSSAFRSPSACGLCPRSEAAGHRGHRRRHAYRQPDHRSRPDGAAFRLLVDFVTTLRADGHTISHVDFGGGFGIPYYEDRRAPPEPLAYAEMVKRVTQQSRLHADVRAGPHDRRQCRHSGHACDLREARGCAEFRHHRRRHE